MTSRMRMIPRKSPKWPTKIKAFHRIAGLVQRGRSVCHAATQGILLLVFSLALQSALLFSPAASLAAGMPARVPQDRPSPNDCIFYATVFNDQGFYVVGAEARAHPAGHKKPEFDAWSDRRGEFAIRVSRLGSYEIQVKADGYITQSQTVTAQEGQKIDLVFHMVSKPKK